MFFYALVEDIRNDLKLFNNTPGFEPNISEQLFSVLSGCMVAELRLTD